MSTGRVFGIRQAMGLKQGQGKRQKRRSEKSKYGNGKQEIRKAKKYRDQERDQESIQELKGGAIQDCYGFRHPD